MYMIYALNIYSASNCRAKCLRSTGDSRAPSFPAVFRSARNQTSLSARRYAHRKRGPCTFVTVIHLAWRNYECVFIWDALVKEHVSYQARYLHNDGSWQRAALRGIIGQMIRLFHTLLLSRKLMRGSNGQRIKTGYKEKRINSAVSHAMRSDGCHSY